MLEPSWWLWGAVLPLIAAAAVMMVCLQPWRTPSPIRTAIAWPLALSLGYAVGSVVFLAVKHALSWPPVEASDFLAMVVLPAAVVVEMIPAVVSGRASAVRWVGRALVIAATPPLMLLPFLKNDWSVGQSIGVCVGLSAAIAVVWVLMDLAAASLRLASLPAAGLSLTITAAGVGVTILTSGSVTLGQLGLTLAAAMFGACLVGVAFHRPIGLQAGDAKPQAASGGGVAVVLLAGLLITGCFYAEVKPWHAAVLAAAPLAPWLGRIPAMQKLKRWQAALIVVVVTALIVAAAVVPAIIAAARAMAESGYE